MTGRTETDSKSRKKTVVYVCSSYMAGRCNGHRSECGYQRITHDEAEQLLRSKMQEIGKEMDEQASTHARMTIEERWKQLVSLDQDAFHEFLEWVKEGVDALLDYLEIKYGASTTALNCWQCWQASFMRRWKYLTEISPG